MILADSITNVPTWPATVAVVALLGSGMSILLSAAMVYFMRRQTELMAAQAARPAPEISPVPLPTTKIFPAATVNDLKDAIGNLKEQVDKHDLEIAELREIIRREIPEMERRLGAAGEERVVKLHQRINEVLAEVSNVEGKLEIIQGMIASNRHA